MSLRRLFIIGAGDFGREIEGHLEMLPLAQRDWAISGFLDDNASALDGFPSDYKVLGNIDSFQFKQTDLAILAISNPHPKALVFGKLRNRVEIITFIAPDAIVGKFSSLGKGCFIGPRVIIGPNVTMGDAVHINSGSMVGHDVTIGDYSSIMANNNIAGHCKIGARCFLSSSVTLIPRRKLCEGAYIGAGSVVIQHVRETRTVFGNPGKYV